MPGKRLLFFDTVVLSNFAFIPEGISFLRTQYGVRGYVSFQVLQEFAKAKYSGWNHLEGIESLFRKAGFIKSSLSESEIPLYIELLRILGEGEASCIALALKRKGIVATDDRLARNICMEKQIPLTGTLGILKAATLDGQLDPDQADRWLNQMVVFGFYSPVKKISDLL